MSKLIYEDVSYSFFTFFEIPEVGKLSSPKSTYLTKNEYLLFIITTPCNLKNAFPISLLFRASEWRAQRLITEEDNNEFSNSAKFSFDMLKTGIFEA